MGAERSSLPRGKTDLVLPSSYRMKDYQDLREQTKLMCKYIKATHHLDNLTDMETEPGPRALRRESAQLQMIVVRASPNVNTGWKLKLAVGKFENSVGTLSETKERHFTRTGSDKPFEWQ